MVAGCSGPNQVLLAFALVAAPGGRFLFQESMLRCKLAIKSFTMTKRSCQVSLPGSLGQKAFSCLDVRGSHHSKIRADDVR